MAAVNQCQSNTVYTDGAFVAVCRQELEKKTQRPFLIDQPRCAQNEKCQYKIIEDARCKVGGVFADNFTHTYLIPDGRFATTSINHNEYLARECAASLKRVTGEPYGVQIVAKSSLLWRNDSYGIEKPKDIYQEGIFTDIVTSVYQMFGL